MTCAGDWVMTGPGPRVRPSLFQRGIMLMGSSHTHDMMVGEVHGKLVCGSAEDPHFVLVDVNELRRKAKDGELVMGVFRFSEFVKEDPTVERLAFGTLVSAVIETMARVEVPYDWIGIESHARNVLRKYLKDWLKWDWLKPILRHEENHVWCTEGCVEACEIAGALSFTEPATVSAMMGRQPLVAPVHAERLVRNGQLVCVENFGLMEKIEGT